MSQSGDNVETVDEKNNEFAYLDREHFTSEKFKIELRNLPRHYGMPELRKLFNKKLSLEANKIKRPHNGSPWLYVCFRSEEGREHGLQVLNGYQWKGQTLSAAIANAVPDPVALRRRAGNSKNCSAKRLKLEEDDELTVGEKLKNATAPLWNKSYEEQLVIKAENVKGILKGLAKNLIRDNCDIKEWIQKQCEIFDGLPCEMLPIRPSPCIDGYRNKCEFTIGLNEATGEKTVGMRLGSYAKGSLSVVSPDECPHVPDIMKKSCRIADKFIQAPNNLDIYNQETHEGYWQTMTARYGFRTNELMLMFIMNPQKLEEAELQVVEEDLRNFFTTGEGSELVVHSLLLGIKINRQHMAVRCVKGESFIHEEVCGKKFRISPQSFFQPNTAASEILYKTISELSPNPSNSSLIDVCCGAGTIGICLSDSFSEILGLEKCAEAVEDANQNAKINNVTNAQFFSGPAETILHAVIMRAAKSNVVAVVDPPRAGLERNAVTQLRRTSQLNQFVYASCNPQLAVKNFLDLGRSPSKQYPNDPFLPIKCVPVDMLPHTDGCELVIFFQRSSLVLK